MAKPEEIVMAPGGRLERAIRLEREQRDSLKRHAADLDRSIVRVDRIWEEIEERRRGRRRSG